MQAALKLLTALYYSKSLRMQESVQHHHILSFPLPSCLHSISYTQTRLSGALDLVKKDRILKLPLMPIHSQ